LVIRSVRGSRRQHAAERDPVSHAEHDERGHALGERRRGRDEQYIVGAIEAKDLPPDRIAGLGRPPGGIRLRGVVAVTAKSCHCSTAPAVSTTELCAASYQNARSAS
jgi:hypothetical protein